MSGRTLAEPATFPPIKRLSITSKLTPEWSVVLHQENNPIEVGEVLLKIYKLMQRGLSEEEWEGLPNRQKSKTYTKRLKTFPKGVDDVVRMVDGLGDKPIFDGLVTCGEGHMAFLVRRNRRSTLTRRR